MKQKLFLTTFSLIVLTLIALAVNLILFRGYTEPIKDASEHTLPNSIAVLEKVSIGGVDQWLLIRGNDVHNPVILFLHGGPGTSEMAFVRHYNADLEKYFVVVNWDQRGAGKSYTGPLPKDQASLDRFVADTHEVVELLKKRFKQDKIYLVGHSWGSMLGLLTVRQYPESFYAYIGAGQVADMVAGELVSYEYTLGKAREMNNQEAVAALEKAGPPLNGFYKDEESEQLEREWLLKLGGSLHGKSNYNDFYQVMLFSKEMTISDIQNLFQFAYPDEFMREYHGTNLFEEVPEVNVPVYFFLGRHDYQTPAVVAEKYLNELHAPHKELVWFENSAHSPLFEESAKFNDLLIHQVWAETFLLTDGGDR